MNYKPDSVHLAMLKEILKKMRIKSDQFYDEHIQEVYAQLFGRKRR